MKINITHLTSVHPRYDTRIYLKECISLAKNNNFNVSLVVADELGYEKKSNIEIFDVGKSNGRINRFFKTTKRIYNKAVELNSDIYHFHDPELIPVALKLKKLGKKVIFDIHENIALQILDKDYIPSIFRSALSKLYRKYEIKNLHKFDYLVLAEYSYKDYYKKLNEKIEIILNMPDITPLKSFYSSNRDKNEIFYIGGISNNRGLDVTIDAIKILKEKIPDIFMHYIGPISNELLDSLDITDIEGNIKFYGRMELYKGLEYSKNCKVGLSILKPIGNYTRSYSTKVFEYMALGLPIVTSDFKLYKDVVERCNCGLCVDPTSPIEIAKAIETILSDSNLAKNMAFNGRNLVTKKFNWENEELKLQNIYKDILDDLYL